MTASRLRSILLFLLVLVSLLLSFSIWHGDWLNPSEAGFSDLPSLTSSLTSSLPQMETTEVPYEIVLKTGRQPAYSVALPGTAVYQDWLQRLSGVELSGLKPMLESASSTAFSTVQIRFGNTLDRAALLQFIPALQNDAFAEQTQTVTFYEVSPGQPVMLELSTPDQPDHYIGRTDLTPEEFQGLIQTAVTEHPWITTGTSRIVGYLPAQPQQFVQYAWKTKPPATIPLIHSFFVDPNALTRIQEQNGEVLWTDGSRAVQWSQTSGMMTFDDPNATSTGGKTANSLDVAVAFIQSHGGSLTNLIPFATGSTEDQSRCRHVSAAA